MTPSDCVNLILAATSGLPAKDAVDAVRTYRNLVPVESWSRDESAPSVDWIAALDDSCFGEVLDGFVESAMRGDLQRLEHHVNSVNTSAYCVFKIRVVSPIPGAMIRISVLTSDDDSLSETVLFSKNFAPRKSAASDFWWEHFRMDEKLDRRREEIITQITIRSLGDLLKK